MVRSQFYGLNVRSLLPILMMYHLVNFYLTTETTFEAVGDVGAPALRYFLSQCVIASGLQWPPTPAYIWSFEK